MNSIGGIHLYSYFEKYLIKHFIYGIIFGFLYALLIRDYFVIFQGDVIDIVNNSVFEFIYGFAKSMFTVAILYTLISILGYIYLPNKSKS